MKYPAMQHFWLQLLLELTTREKEQASIVFVLCFLFFNFCSQKLHSDFNFIRLWFLQFIENAFIFRVFEWCSSWLYLSPLPLEAYSREWLCDITTPDKLRFDVRSCFLHRKQYFACVALFAVSVSPQWWIFSSEYQRWHQALDGWFWSKELHVSILESPPLGIRKPMLSCL